MVFKIKKCNSFRCLLRGNAFYFGVLTPVSIILVSNFIILVLVMISLSTRRVEKLVAKQKKIRSYRRILRSCRIAFAFSSLLGLTWLFAIVAIGMFCFKVVSEALFIHAFQQSKVINVSYMQ